MSPNEMHSGKESDREGTEYDMRSGARATEFDPVSSVKKISVPRLEILKKREYSL